MAFISVVSSFSNIIAGEEQREYSSPEGTSPDAREKYAAFLYKASSVWSTRSIKKKQCYKPKPVFTSKNTITQIEK